MNKDRLSELLAIPFDVLVIDSDLKKDLTEYYKFIYGVKTCSNCKDKFPQYYKKLMTDGISKMEQLEVVSTNNFKLRSNIGVVQINFGDGEFISPTYSPDALCIEFLKANPNRISMFEKYPENWKDIISE